MADSGGLFELTRAAVQAMNATHWGTKVQVPTGFDTDSGKPTDYQPTDTGVNQAIQELMARLASNAPIQLQNPLTLIKPPNGPAIQVINGDGGNVIEVINETTNLTEVFNTTIINENGTTTGFSGSLTVVTGGTISINVSACTVTATFTPTTATLTFANGLCTGAG